MEKRLRSIQNTLYLRVGFYFFWFAISVLQAYNTQLIPDEAYYSLWSHYPAWGYFDHPPIIALIVRIGSWLFKNELGVRLIAICNGTLLIFIIEKLVKPANLILFYCTILSIAVLHFFTFIAVPDSPLLVLTASLYYLYNKYLEKENRLIYSLIAINIALLLLSKYHGILVIFFIIASNPSILKKYTTWVIFLISLIIILPHIIWQYQNGFPSIVYQLFQREIDPYDISMTFEYLSSLLGVFGPWVGTILLVASFFYKPKNLFEKALKYNLIGTLTFFAFMTIKGRVEMNWVICDVIPIIYLGYNKLANSTAYKKIVLYSLPVSILLILLVRIFMIYDFVPEKWKFENEFHGYKPWAKQLKKVTGGRPVVFTHSYQNASEYGFYSDENSFSLSNIYTRKSQFDILSKENEAQGKEVIYFHNGLSDSFDSVKTVMGLYKYRIIKNFHSSSNVNINFIKNSSKAQSGVPYSISFMFNNNNGANVDLESNKDLPAYLWYIVYSDRKKIAEQPTNFQVLNQMLTNNQVYTLNINLPVQKGKYKVFLSIKAGFLPQSINSHGFTIEID